MKKLLYIFLLLGGLTHAADILDLVRILDRNDTSAFNAAVRTLDDANAMRDDNNKTVLMYACWVGNFDAVKHLVTHGADINALDSGSVSALHLAIWKDYNDIALYLLENGASAQTMSLDGMTPLDIAILRQNTVIIEAINQSAPKRKSLF